MKYMIPSIGDKIELTRKWEFPLYFERRNDDLLSRMFPGIKYSHTFADELSSVMITLAKETMLRIDRIYIRKGKSEWDSVTFWITKAPNDEKRPKPEGRGYHWGRTDQVVPEFDKSKVQRLKGARFWAKLDDVNEIYFKPVD